MSRKKHHHTNESGYPRCVDREREDFRREQDRRSREFAETVKDFTIP